MVAAVEHEEEANLSCSSCDYDEHANLSTSKEDLANTDSEGNNCRLLAQSQQKCLPNLIGGGGGGGDGGSVFYRW